MFDLSMKALMQLAAGDDWTWAAAVVTVESDWNRYAISDGGLARGLFQMHPDFLTSLIPDFGTHALSLIIGHADPFVQAEAFRTFWLKRFGHIERADRLGLYHYHGTNLDGWLAQKKQPDPDPDRYIAKVQTAQRIIAARFLPKQET